MKVLSLIFNYFLLYLKNKLPIYFYPRRRSLVKRSKATKGTSKKDKAEAVDLVQKDITAGEPEILEDILATEQFKEAETKESEYKELMMKFTECNNLLVSEKHLKWEKKCWEKYLYKSRDIDPLILSQVNEYLTDLDDDETYDISHVFQECHKSRNMCEEIKVAMLECPEISSKTLQFWMESIRNLHCIMKKKIEIATFLILRAAHEYVNEESLNMEYSVTDIARNNQLPAIVLCLWGNLSKNVRHKGLNLNNVGFSFELPPELLKINCAVRILHTLFDNITPAFTESALFKNYKLGEYSYEVHPGVKIIEEIFSSIHSSDGEGVTSLDHKALSKILEQISSSELSVKKEEQDKGPAMVFTPPEEPEIVVVDRAEYFVVGGLFHFDLFQLPYPTVKAGCWILTNWEEKMLKRIPYKTSIIPIRHPKPDMSPAIAAEFADSEIKRFDKEMCSAISVCLQLPEEVLFLEQPMPAFWVPSKKGFSTIGFFETKFEEVMGVNSWR